MSSATEGAWRGLVLTALCAAALLQGCATPQNRDPLEPVNRKIFRFNEVLDDNVLKPVATGYDKVTPELVQIGIDNFVNNIKDVWSAVNLVLQGRPGMAAQTVLRVSLNTTLGLVGFIDIATPMQLDRQNEDFGQTLAVWGVPSGAYLMLPVLGPSTVRDTAAMPADLYFSPSALFQEPRDANAVRILSIVNKRALLLDASSLLGDVALDRYSFVRDAFLQRRQNLIYNGEPPDGDDEGWDDAAETPPAPAAPADGPVEAAPAQPQSHLSAPAASPVLVMWERHLLVPEQLDTRLEISDEWVTQLMAWSHRPMSVIANSLPAGDELAGLREQAEPR
ncbi:MAG: VacJ family lipoprotein [Rubrivivax sp.]|nr:MAG: VacJ family lipoprotein [Rubrivivax sp.]